MKQVLQNMRDGKTTVGNIPLPSVKRNSALVRAMASLVSAGTERMVVEFAEKNLISKATSRPDLVKQVISKARREGVIPTIEAAFNKLDQPMPLGYSSAGIIEEIGRDLVGFQPGDRVACAGGGFAVHAGTIVHCVAPHRARRRRSPVDAAAFSTPTGLRRRNPCRACR